MAWVCLEQSSFLSLKVKKLDYISEHKAFSRKDANLHAKQYRIFYYRKFKRFLRRIFIRLNLSTEWQKDLSGKEQKYAFTDEQNVKFN